MLLNLPGHHHPDFIRNLNPKSIYYYYQSNYISDLLENFYYYHHHLGPEAIFRSDSTDYFTQSPYSQIPITYIFKTSYHKTKNPNLIKWILKYAALELIEYLLNQKKLEADLIFNLDKVSQLFKLQSDYLSSINIIAGKLTVEYVYLTLDERKRFAQMYNDYSTDEMVNPKVDPSLEVTSLWDKEFQKNRIKEKYQKFWSYYLLRNRDQLVQHKKFMTKDNLENMIQFFLEVSLSEPLILLDELLSQNSYYSSNWDAIKYQFRLSKMHHSCEMVNLFKFLLQISEDDRSKIVESYFGDQAFWTNGLKKLNGESFGNLDSKDFFWIIQNPYISNQKTEGELLIVLLLASVDGYQYQTFLDFYYYALNRNVSSDKIKKIIKRYYQQERESHQNQKIGDFERKVIEFLNN